jgi:UDP-N-acetyl-D-mannosaminuronate dehydrogenase
MSKSDIKIAIIGLGYVGLPLAVEFAKKYQVIGFDINQNRIEELEKNNDTKELKSFCNGLKPVIGDLKSIYNKQELVKEGFSVFRL